MASSLVFFSFARAAPKSARERIAQIKTLRFICSGHCTPVKAVQERFVLAPLRLRPDVQLEEDFLAEKLLHVFASPGSDTFQHSALRADEDSLLPFLLHVDRGQDAREFGLLVPAVDDHGYRVRDFLVGGADDLFAN